MNTQERKVSICENCKRYWIEPPTVCVCGMHSYTTAHPSAVDRAEDKAVVAFLDEVEPYKSGYDDDEQHDFYYTLENREWLKKGYNYAATQHTAELAKAKEQIKELEAIVEQYKKATAGINDGWTWDDAALQPPLVSIEQEQKGPAMTKEKWFEKYGINTVPDYVKYIDSGCISLVVGYTDYRIELRGRNDSYDEKYNGLKPSTEAEYRKYDETDDYNF